MVESDRGEEFSTNKWDRKTNPEYRPPEPSTGGGGGSSGRSYGVGYAPFGSAEFDAQVQAELDAAQKERDQAYRRRSRVSRLPQPSSSRELPFVSGAQEFAPKTQGMSYAPEPLQSPKKRAWYEDFLRTTRAPSERYTDKPSKLQAASRIDRGKVKQRQRGSQRFGELYYENPYDQPFFSKAGQTERLANLKRVSEITSDKLAKGISLGFYEGRYPAGEVGSNIQGTGRGAQQLSRAFEYAANNPASTALMITGTASAGGAVSRSAPKLATSIMGRLDAYSQAVARTYAIGQGTRLSVQEGGYRKLSADQQSFITKNREAFEKSVKLGFQAERDALSDRGGVTIPFTSKKLSARSILNEVPILNLFAGGRSDYKAAATEYWKGRGLRGQDLSRAVEISLKERTTSSLAEGAAFITTSASVEKYGRGAIASAFKRFKGTVDENKLGGTMFKMGFREIGLAGSIEGGVQEAIQQDTRRSGRSGKDILGMAGLGFASAGLIGGGIMGAVNKPTARTGLKAFAYITDPYEKLGDWTADAATAFQKGLNVPVVSPAIIPQGKPKPSVVLGISTSGKPAGKAPTMAQVIQKGGGKAPTVVDLFNPKKGRGRPDVPALTDFFGESAPNTPVPTDTTTDTPTDAQTNAFTDPFTQTNIFTNVQTGVPTNVPVFASVPVSTPMFRLPPPLPLFSGAPSGGRGNGTQKRKSSKFINELDAGFSVLGSMIGGGRLLPKVKTVSKTKPKKRSKRRKR